MPSHEDLYKGFSSKEVKEMGAEVADKYGKEALETSETYLKKLTKAQLEVLKTEQKEIFKNLFALSSEPPTSEKVQSEIARHYVNIRKFWGTLGTSDNQAEAYKGLGELYVADERYTKVDGVVQPQFAAFLVVAMAHFVDSQL